MRPVFQTRTEVDPDRGICGNCFQAAVASILELSLESVPDFMQEDLDRRIAAGATPRVAWDGDWQWWDALQEWLREQGLMYIEISSPDSWTDIHPSLGFHLINGKSPRGDYDHTVVGYAGKIVHDPRQDANGSGLESQKGFGFFVPINPANAAKRGERR